MEKTNAEFEGLFVRDSLQDTGVVPSPGYSYHSPDMINYEQVPDPKTVFTNSYGSDPNKALEVGQWNYIYCRAKNLSQIAQEGIMKCYWSKTSLVMNPGNWKNNILQTAEGNSSVDLPSVSQNQITVSPTPFAWRPPSDNPYGYCMIGQVITSAKPNPIPGNFDNWAAFVNWVRQNQNICWRNLTILDQYPNPQWDQLMTFENIEDKDVPSMFTTISSDNIPVGTKVTLKCQALGINETKEITSNSKSRVLTASNMCPAKFQGSVETMGLLPGGQSWPSGGTITTTAYIGEDRKNDLIAQHASPWEIFSVKPQEIKGLHKEHGVLVKVGNCTVLTN